jgi:hypothetical protein
MICRCGLNVDLIQRPGYVEVICPACGQIPLRDMDQEILESNPDIIYVHGDDTKGGSGWRSWRFVTHRNDLPYTADEYQNVFFSEVYRLVMAIKNHSDKIFFIGKLGKGSNIFEKFIAPELKKMLRNFENVYYFF